MTRELSGELDYRIRYDVEHDLFHAQNVFNDEYIKPTFIEYVQKLEKENAELKADNDARKFAMAMSEKVEKQLREQIEKMKCCATCKSFKGYGETCEGWGEPVLNLNCDCTEWELRR